MGLQIRRVTQTKYKLLFASLAIMALAVQPLYGFVASQIANAKTTDGPVDIAEFTATSKCVAGKVAVGVTGLSKSSSAQASAEYSTTIGKKLTGEWKDIKTGVTAEGTLQSDKGKASDGTVTFMVPLGVNTGNFYKYTANYDAIDCGPVFGATTPVDGTTVTQTNQRYEISAEVTSSTSTVESVTWEMTGAKKISSSSTHPKFKKVSSDKWAASYETVNIPTGNYKLTFTATDVAGNKTHKTIENISLKPDTDGPVISNIKINNQSLTASSDACPQAEPLHLNKTIDISAILEDPSGVSKANFDLANVNSKNCSNGNLGVGRGMAVAEDGKIKTSFDTKSVSEGVYLLKLRAWDAKNNLNSAHVLIQVDNTNPVVAVQVDKTTNPTQVSGTVKDALSGADYAEYSIGTGVGTEFKYIAGMNFPNNARLAVDADGNFSGSINTSGLEDGSYTLRARGFDKAGNKKSGVDIPFTVKTEKPSGSGGEDDGNTGSQGNNNTDGGNDENRGDNTKSSLDEKDTMDGVDGDTLSPLGSRRSSSPNSIFNRSYSLNLNADGTDSDHDTDTLGDSTFNKSLTQKGDVKGAADNKSGVASMFGLAWYWWLLIVAAVAAIWWWIAAARKRNQDA